MLLLVVVAGVPLVLAVPAAATSCVGFQGVTPQKLLAGEPVHGQRLFENYDLAVVGTVTGIRTNDAQRGAARTTVDVHAAFGVEELPPVLDVSSDDAGAMNGFPFERGTTYFIPLEHPGPQGQPHYSFVCDPILEVPGPAAAGELQDVAADNGVMVAELAAPNPPPAVAAGLSLGGVVAIAGLAVTAIAGVGLLAAVAGRRRASSPAGSDFPA